MGYKLPLIFFAYTLGALSIIGVPPFIGSWSKFYLIMGSIEREFIIVAIILGISSLLNIYYLLQPVVIGFTQNSKKEIKLIKTPLTVWPPLITGLGCLVSFLCKLFLNNIILINSELNEKNDLKVWVKKLYKVHTYNQTLLILLDFTFQT